MQIRCIRCGGAVDASRRCGNCGHIYPERNGIPVFLDEEGVTRAFADQAQDAENAFKDFFKRWPRMYRVLVNLFVPVLFYGLSARRFLAELQPQPERILNLGSGPTVLHPRATNVDLFPFPNVHLLAEAEHLPFADATFDAVVSEQVLEHVRGPWRVAKEVVRVTKPGGLIYIATPYMFPLHPSPKDYSRWSIDGLADLFEGCDLVRSGTRNGPVSGMLIVMSMGLATIFSFGISPVRKVLNYLCMALLSPFKVLDYVYANLPGADVAAGSVYVVLKKRG
jgi:SAM-dependent methyltransferase